MMAPEVLRFLVENGTQWIREQRDVHRPTSQSVPLGPDNRMGRFFTTETLAAARFKWVPVLENPPFFAGMDPPPIDFTTMSGITYADTFLVSESQRPPTEIDLAGLMFHELVHVVQYGVLGVDEFMERYVAGWAQNGFSYDAIPLEAMAYELAGRFIADPRAGFSVEDEITSRLRTI